MKLPKKGDKLYIPSTLHISRGSDDVAGGIATISEVEIKDPHNLDNPNAIFVSFKEIPGVNYNYKNLINQQEKLSKDYAGKVAHPDPDEDRPWIEDGDIVNGQVWNKGNVW